MSNIKEIKDLKVLLIQLRKNEAMLPAERSNFLAHTGLVEEQLISLDAYRNPNFDHLAIDDFDAFFIGGLSSDPSDSVEVSSRIFPFLESFNKILVRAEHLKIPGLLSCGGFMLASVLWGGRIEIDDQKREMGVYDLFLNSFAREDLLFGDMESNLKIISGHIKSTIVLPPNSILLGSTKRCPIHIIRLKDAPIYAFQGHPEITSDDLYARVSAYKDKYFDSEEAYQRFISIDGDTAPINGILKKFLQLTVAGKFV